MAYCLGGSRSIHLSYGDFFRRIKDRKLGPGCPPSSTASMPPKSAAGFPPDRRNAYSPFPPPTMAATAISPVTFATVRFMYHPNLNPQPALAQMVHPDHRSVFSE